jgi:cell division protein FtsB
VVLVLVLFAVLASYVNPVVNFFDAWRGSHTERTELQALSHEHSRLAAKVAALKRPGAASEEARRMGMIASGERAYVIQSLGH